MNRIGHLAAVMISAWLMTGCESGSTDVDKTPPVLKLLGDNPMTVPLNQPCKDPGATAVDAVDGYVKITCTGTVDTSKAGRYVVTYRAVDRAGNVAEKSRVVLVGSQNAIDKKTFRLYVRIDGSHSFEIPTSASNTQYGYPYDYAVDCDDDGTFEATHVTGNYTCSNYPADGNYTIVIKGDFPHIYFNNIPGAKQVLAVEQWGTIKWSSMAHAFEGCKNMVLTASDVPDLSQVKEMDSMFANAYSLTGDVTAWDVSNVEIMDYLFSGCRSLSGNDLRSWDVGNVVSHDYFSDGWGPNNVEPNWNATQITTGGPI